MRKVLTFGAAAMLVALSIGFVGSRAAEAG
jgi:hypothetical protein